MFLLKMAYWRLALWEGDVRGGSVSVFNNIVGSFAVKQAVYCTLELLHVFERNSQMYFNTVRMKPMQWMIHLVLAEATACEPWKQTEHLGCLVIKGRTHGFCFRSCEITLATYLMKNLLLRKLDAQRYLDRIIAGVEHVRKLDLVHNDLHPENIMLKDRATDRSRFRLLCTARQMASENRLRWLLSGQRNHFKEGERFV